MVTPLKNHYPNLSPKSLENMRNFDFEGWGPTLAAYKKDKYIYIYIYIKFLEVSSRLLGIGKFFGGIEIRKCLLTSLFYDWDWQNCVEGIASCRRHFSGFWTSNWPKIEETGKVFWLVMQKNWWILSAALLSIPTKQLLKTWTEVSVCKKSDAVLKHFIFLNNVMVSGFVYWTSSNLCQKEWIIIPCDIGSYDGCGTLFLISNEGTLGSF